MPIVLGGVHVQVSTTALAIGHRLSLRIIFGGMYLYVKSNPEAYRPRHGTTEYVPRNPSEPTIITCDQRPMFASVKTEPSIAGRLVYDSLLEGIFGGVGNSIPWFPTN